MGPTRTAILFCDIFPITDSVYMQVRTNKNWCIFPGPTPGQMLYYKAGGGQKQNLELSSGGQSCPIR